MIVTCASCYLCYDDTYHWTFCPHERFEMRLVVNRGDGQSKLCTSVAELLDFIEKRGEDDATALP